LPPISPPLFLNLSLLLESFFSFLSLFVLELEPLRRFSEPDEVEIEDTEAEAVAVGSDELVRFNNLKLYLFGVDGSSLRLCSGLHSAGRGGAAYDEEGGDGVVVVPLLSHCCCSH